MSVKVRIYIELEIKVQNLKHLVLSGINSDFLTKVSSGKFPYQYRKDSNDVFQIVNCPVNNGAEFTFLAIACMTSYSQNINNNILLFIYAYPIQCQVMGVGLIIMFAY